MRRAPSAFASALLMVVGVGSATGARAQEASLSLKEAVELALASHPSVAAASAASAVSRAELRTARADLFPSLAASGSAARFQEPMVVTPIHGLTAGATPAFDRTLLQGAVQLSYTLYDGGARGARISSSRELAGAAGDAEAQARQALIRTTAGVFLEVGATRSLLAAHESRIAALDAEFARVRDARDVGRVAPVDVMRVETALAGAHAERVEVAAALDVAEARLARLVGWDVDDVSGRVIALAEPPVGMEPERALLLAEALDANPELRGARRQHAAARAARDLAGSARWPKVEAGAAYVDRGGGDTSFQGEWSATLQVSVPLFTGGAVSSRVDRAEAGLWAAAERVRLAELQVADDVDTGLSALAGARARAESLARAVASSEEIARIERLGVETGVTTEADYLDAEAALLQARAALLRAKTGEAASWLRLAEVTGALSPAWIAETLR